jgi:hypothetical protein
VEDVPVTLSESFSIDPRAEWVITHNREAREVVAAYEADRPVRVPILGREWPGQHGFYAEETHLDYREYYTDPDEMLRVQLEAARRRRELPVCDWILAEPPDEWTVSVDLWPVVGPAWVGCRLLYRKDAVIAHEGRRLSKEECDAMAMPGLASGGILDTVIRFRKHLRERYADLRFLGRPLAPIGSGVGTNGFFSLALDLRAEELMADMYDDPEFAHRFLLKVASWCNELDRTWRGLAGQSGSPEHITLFDHGVDMLSPELYEEFLVPILHETKRRNQTFSLPVLHHCGRGAHLFPVIKKHFGLRAIEALTFPLNDVAKVRRDIGDDLWIVAVVEDPIVQAGPEQRIRETVRELMKAKGRGRFALQIGDMLPGTPIEHRLALYDAVKEFGGY